MRINCGKKFREEFYYFCYEILVNDSVSQQFRLNDTIKGISEKSYDLENEQLRVT